MTEVDKEVQHLCRIVERQKKQIEKMTYERQLDIQEETRLRREIESLKIMLDDAHRQNSFLLGSQ